MGDHKAKTVIIIGAGASHEFGLPVGMTLMKKISDFLSEDCITSPQHVGRTEIESILRECEKQGNHSYGALREAAEKIINGLPYAQSIDNFLHNNKSDPAIILVGKIAIASTIIQQEKDSTLYSGPEMFFSVKERQEGVKKDDSWLHRYFKILVSNKSFKEFIRGIKQTTFISFNYDRCVQQFFWNAATAYFTTEEDAGEKTLEALNIIYTYGSVGEFKVDYAETSFGNENSSTGIIEAANSLKIFTEGENQGIKNKIQDAMYEAHNILILGFGFIPINMDLLFSGEKFGRKVILSTAFNLSNPDITQINKKVSSAFFWRAIAGGKKQHIVEKGLIHFEKMTASGLFYEYSQYLSQKKVNQFGRLLTPK